LWWPEIKTTLTKDIEIGVSRLRPLKCWYGAGKRQFSRFYPVGNAKRYPAGPGRFVAAFNKMFKIQKNILLAPYTTFRIGGPAKYFSEASSTKEIKELCKWAEKENVPVLALGGGSNVLISDKGFNGLVIKIQNSKFKIQNSKIIADAGVPLAKIVAEAAGAGLSGLEWAIGIPGTIGGAINGNAGAFGRATSEAVEEVEAFDILEHSVKNFKKEDCRFGYRKSIFKRNPDLIILSAIIRLKNGSKEEMRKAIQKNARQKKESNPVGFSAGCYFKNIGWEEIGIKKDLIAKFPELKKFADKPKISAGSLIENVGLKGKKIGGAVISEKHANFIINVGNAKAKDVINLANLVKEKVRKRYGFDLEDEVVAVI